MTTGASSVVWALDGQFTRTGLHGIYVLRRRWSSVRVADDPPGARLEGRNGLVYLAVPTATRSASFGRSYWGAPSSWNDRYAQEQCERRRKAFGIQLTPPAKRAIERLDWKKESFVLQGWN